MSQNLTLNPSSTASDQMMIVGDELQRCQEYVDALREERRKIFVFRRELPLCLDLVTQAIEACKQQLSETKATDCRDGQSECNSEQTTSDDGPVFEEYMPSKRNSCSDDEHELHKSKSDLNNDGICDERSLKKSDWLESAQLSLWNQTLDPPKKEVLPKKVPVLGVKRDSGCGAFHPFKRDEKDGQEQRKARRCWSPELHRLFLQALQQLGGSHVATPKRIREMMKVDGLTNDEVKSHLQKYRLHSRRPRNTTVRGCRRHLGGDFR